MLAAAAGKLPLVVGVRVCVVRGVARGRTDATGGGVHEDATGGGGVHQDATSGGVWW